MYIIRGVYYRSRITRSANSQAKNQVSRPAGATHCTHSRVIWYDPRARGSASLRKISPQSVHGAWNPAPKYQKNPLLVKESCRVGKTLDRFLNVLADFIANLQKFFKSDVICFTRYGVIDEKPRVGHLHHIFAVHPVRKSMRWIEKK